MKIKEMSAIYENGDKLILTLKESKFAGYNSCKLWELFYAEKVYTKPEEEVNEKDEYKTHYFNTHRTEYFPEDASSQAIQAFNIRRTCSNPTHESDQGYDLNKILSNNSINI